jgi:hypothetical protein
MDRINRMDSRIGRIGRIVLDRADRILNRAAEPP